jgi:hypothetical protein
MEIKCTHQDAGVTRSFDRDSIIVGRSNPFLPPDLDLSDDVMVSRTHARIWLRDGRWWIEDLASKHGTWVNGVKINYRRQLNPGDVIRVGETVLEISPPPARTSAIQPPAEPNPVTEIDSALNVEEFAPVEKPPASTPALSTEMFLASLAARLSACGKRDAPDCIARHLATAYPKARRVIVLLRDGPSGSLRTAASHPTGVRAVNESLALRTLAEGRALLWRETVESLNERGQRHDTGACGLCAPVFHRHQPLGVLCVESDDGGASFTEADLKTMLGAAGLAALALRPAQ